MINQQKQAVSINGDSIPPLWSLPTSSGNIQQSFLFCGHYGYCIAIRRSWSKTFWNRLFWRILGTTGAAIDGMNKKVNRGQETHCTNGGYDIYWANIFFSKCSVNAKIWNQFDWSPVLVWLNVYITSERITRYLEQQNFVGKTGTKIENEVEDQDQWNPKWIRILTVLRCIWYKFGNPDFIWWGVIACTE